MPLLDVFDTLDPEIKIKIIKHIKNGHSSTVRHLSLGSHTGTHMDAPSHFLSGGRAIDQMPFEAVVGPARVLTIKDQECVTARELDKHNIRPGERLLLKTLNS